MPRPTMGGCLHNLVNLINPKWLGQVVTSVDEGALDVAICGGPAHGDTIGRLEYLGGFEEKLPSVSIGEVFIADQKVPVTFKEGPSGIPHVAGRDHRVALGPQVDGQQLENGFLVLHNENAKAILGGDRLHVAGRYRPNLGYTTPSYPPNCGGTDPLFTIGCRASGADCSVDKENPVVLATGSLRRISKMLRKVHGFLGRCSGESRVHDPVCWPQVELSLKRGQVHYVPMQAYKVGVEILVTVSQYERGNAGRVPHCICLGPEEMTALANYLGREVSGEGIRFRGIPVQRMLQPGIRVIGEGESVLGA